MHLSFLKFQVLLTPPGLATSLLAWPGLGMRMPSPVPCPTSPSLYETCLLGFPNTFIAFDLEPWHLGWSQASIQDSEVWVVRAVFQKVQVGRGEWWGLEGCAGSVASREMNEEVNGTQNPIELSKVIAWT